MTRIIIKNGQQLNAQARTFTEETMCIENDIIVKRINDDDKTSPIIIDASGLHVFPGLIDFHGHFFEGGSEFGVNPDLACLQFGVTSAVDAGSAGVSNFEMFSKNVMSTSKVTMKAFLNVSPVGMVTMKFHENLNPVNIDCRSIEKVLRRYSGQILGLKIRMSKELVNEYGMDPFIKTIFIADKLKCRVNVHAADLVSEVDELLSYLRSGDIFTHVFHGKGRTILDLGRVRNVIWYAKKRGIIFDTANGKNHFSFETAKKALDQGFIPDIISTDLSQKTLTKPPVYSLIHILSQYLNMGLPLEDIIPACTKNPAKAMRMEREIGSLKLGFKADITIVNVIKKKIVFEDSSRMKKIGDRVIEPVVTIKDGMILYLNPKYTDIVTRL